MKFDFQNVLLSNLKKAKDFSCEKINVCTQKLLENRICLGITGLSHSGKTTFITSLINILEQDPDLQVKILNEESTFPYADYLKQIIERQEWPVSTTKKSEIHLKIDRQGKEFFLDIFDYPGEWLLDLPLIQRTYSQWSSYIKDYISKIKEENSFLKFDFFPSEEKNIRQTIDFQTKKYVEWLKEMQKKGYSFTQPGHFLLPAEAGDVYYSVNFFPWVFDEPQTDFEKELYKELEQRYDDYKENIVKPFYQNFKAVQKQIILVDTFGSLSCGYQVWEDLKYTIKQLLDNFSYSKVSEVFDWIRDNLFHIRKIEKVMFCSTKLDRLSNTQDAISISDGILHGLVENILRRENDFIIKRDRIEYHSVSSIKACDFQKSSEWSFYTPNGTEAVPVPNLLTEDDINKFSELCSACEQKQLKPIVQSGKIKYQNMAYVLKFIFGDK